MRCNVSVAWQGLSVKHNATLKIVQVHGRTFTSLPYWRSRGRGLPCFDVFEHGKLFLLARSFSNIFLIPTSSATVQNVKYFHVLYKLQFYFYMTLRLLQSFLLKTVPNEATSCLQVCFKAKFKKTLVQPTGMKVVWGTISGPKLTLCKVSKPK